MSAAGLRVAAPDRDALRQFMRRRRRALAAPVRTAADAAAQAAMVAHPDFAAATTLGLYRSFDGEVSTDALALAAREAGKRIVYARPRHGALRSEVLEFVEARSWTRTPGGLPVPHGPTVDLNAIDLLIVPGLAFDQAGNRLGFGHGHYDRTLVGATIRTAGLAYDFQVVEALPAKPWDHPMDLVITDRGVRAASIEERNR